MEIMRRQRRVKMEEVKSMSEPRYTEDIFTKMFLWMSIGWIAMGLIMGMLGYIGALKPRAGSSGIEMDFILFIVFGIIFFIAQSVQRAIASRKKKLHNELIANGTKVNGTVEKVCLQNLVRYGGKSPYIILYSYTCQGKVYQGESYLFWDIPDVLEHAPIVVYTDNAGKSTIQLE